MHRKTAYSVCVSASVSGHIPLRVVLGMLVLLAIMFVSFSPSVAFASNPPEGEPYYFNNYRDRDRPLPKYVAAELCSSTTPGACECYADRVWGFYRELCVETPQWSTYTYPAVVMHYYVWGSGVESAIFTIGQCNWLHWLRHCARLTAGGKHGNTLIGQNSGGGGNQVPMRICVFDDPLDLMDTNSSYSPFHKNTSPAEASAIKDQMEKNNLAGQKDFASSSGAAVDGWDDFFGAVFNASYNNIVGGENKGSGNIGCAPVPLAPMPPPYCDTCSVEPPTPDPDIAFKAGATFEEPTVELTIKELLRVSSKYLKYEIKKDDTPLELNIGECKTRHKVEYCSQFGDSDVDTTAKTVCIKRSGDSGVAGQTDTRILTCLARPDYMPLPEVAENASSATDNPKINVTLGAAGHQQSAVLSINDENSKCAKLHGVQLCAERECLSRNKSTGVCEHLDSKICVSGYDPVPKIRAQGYDPSKQVVVYSDTYADVSKRDTIVEGAPNTSGFDKQGQQKWYYQPKEVCTIYDPNNPSQCIQYDMSANVLGPDYRLRLFKPEELGLCVGGTWNKEQTSSGTYTSNVPKGCTRMKMTLIGAGASGSWHTGTDAASASKDYSGGAGGYLQVEMDVNSGESIKAVTGAGGKVENYDTYVAFGVTHNAGTKAKNGGSSYVELGGTTVAQASGGSGSSGGSSSVTASGRNADIISNHKGGDGRSTHGGQLYAGGNAYNQPQQSKTECDGHSGKKAPTGGGGCSKDDVGAYTIGYYGDGGDGYMKLECTQYAETPSTATEGPMP